MSSADLRLLLIVVAVVAVVYLVGRFLRSGRGGSRGASSPRDPTATIRQLARVGDVDGLRHFLTSKTSSDEVRAAAEEELMTMSRGSSATVAARALVALGSGLARLDAARQKDTVERISAELRGGSAPVLSWLTSGPSLDPAGPLVAAVSAIRKDASALPAARVAASAALLGAGVLGARAGAFLAAYRRQLDVEEQEDDDMGGGTALFSDPFDEACAVVSPVVGGTEEILLSTSGKVFQRRKVADERISEASDGQPARVERRWEINPIAAERLAELLGPCLPSMESVVSDEPRTT